MHRALFWTNLVLFIAVSISFIGFFARAIEVRVERPQLLRSTASFFIPFLLAPALSMYSLFLLPLFLLIMFASLFTPPQKGKQVLLWIGLGGTTGLIASFLYLFLLNSYPNP